MPTKESLDELAISEAEYEAIVERLGREPNDLWLVTQTVLTVVKRMPEPLISVMALLSL